MKKVDSMLRKMFEITEPLLVEKIRYDQIKSFFFVEESELQHDMEYYYPELRVNSEKMLKILFLTMLSNYYLFTTAKNSQHGKNLRNPLELFLNNEWISTDFLHFFKKKEYEYLLDLIIEANEKIYSCHYLYPYLLRQNIKNSDKLREATKINRYLAVDILTLDAISLTPGEIIMAEIIELYNSLYVEEACEEETKGDETETELEQEDSSIYQLLCDDIKEYYLRHYDEDKLSEVALYMISNVVESGVTSVIQIPELKAFLEDIRDEDKETLCDRFNNDDLFGELVCRYFVVNNKSIDYAQVKEKRKKLKETEDVKIIESLNPFYQEEESLWQKRITI